eukprot:4131762-Lingulodinium_polyedra.AAC.1
MPVSRGITPVSRRSPAGITSVVRQFAPVSRSFMPVSGRVAPVSRWSRSGFTLVVRRSRAGPAPVSRRFRVGLAP